MPVPLAPWGGSSLWCRNLLPLVLLFVTVSGQDTCHGVADHDLCDTFYDADPANFCDNE